MLQVLIDPQSLDLDGAYTGLVCIMHFSDNGSKIQLEYYSPLLNMHKKGNDKTIDLNYKPVTSDESINVGDKINTTDLKDYGLELEYLGAPLSKPTTLNGRIANGEYSYSRKVSKGDSTHLSGVWKDDITEYFGYDKNYIYYAFTTKFSGTPTVNIQFSAADTLMNAEDYSAYLSRRAVFRFTADSDGVGIIEEDNWGTSKWNKDGFAGAYVNNGTHTYEFKISISFLKSYFGVTSLDTVGMLVYLGYDDIGDEMWIRHNLSSEAVAVLRNSGVGTNPSGWIYRYFLLKSDPNQSKPTSTTTTKTTATTPTAQPTSPSPTTATATETATHKITIKVPSTDKQTAQTTTSTEAETTPITPDTQTNITTPTTTTVAESSVTTGGCNSRLNLSLLVIFPTIALSAFVLSEKKKSE